MLANSYTDTRWFHQLASCASAICFTLGRISFVSQKGDIAAPIQGNAFFYLGNEPDKFAKEFEVIGLIARLKYEAPD